MNMEKNFGGFAAATKDPDAVICKLLLKELREVYTNSLAVFRPPPKQTVSEWSPENINMSTKHDSIAGPYVPFAYQREILDISADLATREIILMTSAQVGKTWSMLVIAAHRMKTRPCGIVWAMDSKESVEFLSSSRFDPMVEESAALKEIVAEKGYRQTTNKILYKDYLGGFMRFATAGSKGQLASAAAPLALADEVDKWEKIKDEGDPLGLLQARMKMQPNPLLVAASTPTIKDESRIERLYNQSDRRRFFVPCPHCGKEHLLIFDNIEWESKVYKTKKEYLEKVDELYNEGIRFFESLTTKNKLHFPDTAAIACPGCGTLLSDYEKNEAVSAGRWIAERPFMGSAGFHLNEIYSPKRTLADIVLDYLKKKDDPESKQVFTNATLGLPWEIPSDKMKSAELAERCETYYSDKIDEKTGEVTPAILPKDGAILTAGVDVQHDRLEVSVRLWGLGFESWGIEYLILYGDPARETIWEKPPDDYIPTVWNELYNLLEKEYPHPNGMNLRIQKCAIDSGYAMDHVLKFVHHRKWPAIAIKGKGGAGLPIHNGKPSRANDLKVPVYTLGVDTIKNTIYQRSFIKRDGPGKIHWNQNYNEVYFKQFTAEKRIKKPIANGYVYAWECPPGKDNEGLDTEVYALAALHLMGMGDIQGTIKTILGHRTPKPKPKEKEISVPKTDYNTFRDDL